MIDRVYRLASAPLGRVLRQISKGRLPQTAGTIRLRGIESEVQIVRDSWGIPRIVGQNPLDLFFAQGYVHAQDRLWQLDINRRAAAGRLAEVLGSEALDTDRLTRALGFRRLATGDWRKASSELKREIEAYSRGVNAFIEKCHRLPLEFSILGYKPEPWTPVDSVAFARLMAWSLSSGWAGELTRVKLREKLGANLASILMPDIPESNPITLPDGIENGDIHLDPKMDAASGPYLKRGLEGGGRGSNGWVLAGSRTTTGLPILSNDMHLPVPSPSLWYFNKLYQLEADGDNSTYRAVGVSQPGLPYILIGHNEYISWGATLSMVDTEDLFLEEWHSESESLYRFGDEWLEADCFEETIHIKNRPPHLEPVKVTRHGPIISPIIAYGERSIALSSIALEPGASIEGFAHIGRANNWSEFVEAIRTVRAPSLNLIYADTAGNIGYWVSGRVPIRADNQGDFPKVGWTGENEWIGEIPFEEMPHSFNPGKGYIITANNKIVDDDYPYYLGTGWRNGYRAARIQELLELRDLHSPLDCSMIQMDDLSLPGLKLAGIISSSSRRDTSLLEVHQLIQDWNGRLNTSSNGGTVIQVMLKTLSEELLSSILGPELLKEYLGEGPHSTLAPISDLSSHWTSTLLRLLEDQELLEKFSTKSLDELLFHCLSMTTSELEERLGSNMSKWKWGNLHQIKFPHTFGRQRLLDEIFSQGPFPIGGDSDTINQVAIAPGDDYSKNSVAPAYRQVIDLGAFNNSKAMFAPGQSGQLGSLHYGDLVQPWLTGSYFSMANVDEDEISSELKLIPDNHEL